MIKNLIKKNETLTKIIKPVYRYIKTIPRKLGYYKAPKMLQGELNLFNAIYTQCKIIVDVGTRYDIDYIAISRGNGINYFLFEANPKFYRKLLSNLKPFNENIFSENIAVGGENGLVDYYEDIESLFKNWAERDSNQKLKKPLKMIRLDDYFKNKSIDTVDFLKTDIEGYDYFALIGLGNYLNKCKFIQFELGIGAPFGEGFVTNEDYYNLLEKNYDLYIIKDENNPLWKNNHASADLIPLDDLTKKIICQAQLTGVGFNVFCVNKGMSADINLLRKAYLTQEIYAKNIFQ